MTILSRVLALTLLNALPLSSTTAEPLQPGELADEISRASAGDIVELPGGNYGSVTIDNVTTASGKSRPVTITSADPTDPAVFGSLKIHDSDGLTINGVVLDYRFSDGDPKHYRPFEVTGSEDITIANSLIEGDSPEGVSDMDDAHGWAVGFHVRDSESVTLQGNRIGGFMRGTLVRNVDDVTVSGNEISDIRSDGMNFVAVEGAVIEDNFIHDFSRAMDSSDHSDMIQFWTRGTDRPSANITIRGNVLLSGNGDPTQSIFMRNDMVDRGVAGREMFYKNVSIEDNVIVNGHLHGISLGESDGVSIANNTLLRSSDFSQGDMEERSVFIPKINLANTSTNVSIADNIASGFPEDQPAWRMEGNIEVQDISVMRPNYYHKLFAKALTGNPANLENFVYQPDLLGLHPDRQTGAPLLMPSADRSRFR